MPPSQAATTTTYTSSLGSSIVASPTAPVCERQHSSPLAGLAHSIKASRFILHSLLHPLAPITPSASECHACCFPFVRYAAQHDIISISLTLRFSSLAQVWQLSARDRHIVALCALGSGMEPSFRAGSIANPNGGRGLNFCSYGQLEFINCPLKNY
jgi:hypothetical protein